MWRNASAEWGLKAEERMKRIFNQELRKRHE
jgi:hypothetical protein